MTQRRAWHTDGQRFILHTILNRHSLKPYSVDCELIKFNSAVCDQPDSVHSSIVKNRDLILRRDQHLNKNDIQVKLFRDEVRELYQILEGLQAETENVSKAGIKFKLSWEQQVQGWNYMEFLNHKPRMEIYEAELRKTCGQWPAFARDNGAVIFFADNFNNVIQPATSAGVCNTFMNVPQDKDYLTIQVSTLCKILRENHSLPDQALVTATGLQWQISAHLFELCPKSGISSTRQDSCRCDRIQQFSSRSRNAKIELPDPLPQYGAAIFGRHLSTHNFITPKLDFQESPRPTHNFTMPKPPLSTPDLDPNVTVPPRKPSVNQGLSDIRIYSAQKKDKGIRIIPKIEDIPGEHVIMYNPDTYEYAVMKKHDINCKHQ